MSLDMKSAERTSIPPGTNGAGPLVRGRLRTSAVTIGPRPPAPRPIAPEKNDYR